MTEKDPALKPKGDKFTNRSNEYNGPAHTGSGTLNIFQVPPRLLLGVVAAIVAIAVIAVILAVFVTQTDLSGDRKSTTGSRAPSTTSAPPSLDVVRVEAFGLCDAFALPAVLGAGQSYAQLTDSAPTGDGWGTFLHGVSGSPVSSVGIALTLSSAGSMRVTDIEVKQVKPPGPNDSGALIPLPHQGGGDDSYNFTVDLDRPNATLQGVAGQEDFPGFEINVAPGLGSTVLVQFTGMEHSYSWVFVVDYDEDGTAKTMQVGNPAGGPFTLTGPSAAYGQVFAADGPGYSLTGKTTPAGNQ